MYKYSQQELTMINERKLQEIQNVSNALNELKAALSSDEFTKPFEFKKPADASEHIAHGSIKHLAKKLNDKNIGFDPSLIIQHIEKEVLRQFNENVEAFVKGMSVENLMIIKHELEKFDLKDRIEFFSNKLSILEKELDLPKEVKPKKDKK